MSTGSGWTFECRWLVLEQFDQMIAKDHFSRRHGNCLAHAELIGALRPLPFTQALQIVHEIPEAVDKIEPPLGLCANEDVGVRQWEVRRCENIERLSRHEIETLGVFLVDAAHARYCGMPPFL